MIKYALLFILVAFVVAEDAEIELDQGVLVLTDSNFETALESNQHILVEFCKYSLLNKWVCVV